MIVNGLLTTTTIFWYTQKIRVSGILICYRVMISKMTDIKTLIMTQEGLGQAQIFHSLGRRQIVCMK